MSYYFSFSKNDKVKAHVKKDVNSSLKVVTNKRHTLLKGMSDISLLHAQNFYHHSKEGSDAHIVLDRQTVLLRGQKRAN